MVPKEKKKMKRKKEEVGERGRDGDGCLLLLLIWQRTQGQICKRFNASQTSHN